MSVLKELINVIISQNHIILFPNMGCASIVYVLVFFVLFLENAIVPAIFLPGDSLLIILGILIAKGVLNFFITLSVLTIAAGLGSWMGYLQGKFLENNTITKRWLSRLPCKLYQKANCMFHKYGIFILFFGRFVVFLRTLLPTIAGVSGLRAARFQLFNWISSFVWVLMLIIIGFYLERLGSIVHIF